MQIMILADVLHVRNAQLLPVPEPPVPGVAGTEAWAVVALGLLLLRRVEVAGLFLCVVANGLLLCVVARTVATDGLRVVARAVAADGLCVVARTVATDGLRVVAARVAEGLVVARVLVAADRVTLGELAGDAARVEGRTVAGGSGGSVCMRWGNKKGKR